MPDTRRAPHPVDVIVGQNVLRLRKQRNMSQETLADGLDVTFQQVQKYEKGINRISCSRLTQIATALQAPLHEFFRGVNLNTGKTYVDDLAEFAATPCALDFIKAIERMHTAKVEGFLRSCAKLADAVTEAETVV